MLFNLLVIGYFLLGLGIAIWSDDRVRKAKNAQAEADGALKQSVINRISFLYAERVLSDIANINHYDPQYELWARTMASNAVAFLKRQQ